MNLFDQLFENMARRDAVAKQLEPIAAQEQEILRDIVKTHGKGSFTRGDFSFRIMVNGDNETETAESANTKKKYVIRRDVPSKAV